MWNAMRGRLCALLLTYCCIITANASYVNIDVYTSGMLASGSDAAHPVCGNSFTVLTLTGEFIVPGMMCKIFEEISHSLALSLLASHPGAVVTELCCRLMSEQCEGGTTYNVTGSQVILLGSTELFVPLEHVHGPILLPARRVGFPAAVAQGWLPPSTSACC